MKSIRSRIVSLGAPSRRQASKAPDTATPTTPTSSESPESAPVRRGSTVVNGDARHDTADWPSAVGLPIVSDPREERSDVIATIRRFISQKWVADSPIVILVIVYICYFSVASLKLLAGRGYPSFDLAIFDQGVWLLGHFHDPFVTIIGRNLFGDHAQFILIPVAFVARLFPEPEGLLVLQWTFIGATAVPIYLTARKLTGSRVIATALGAAFLLNPTTQQVNVMQFHPECFLVFFIVTAVYAAIESRYVLLFVMVVLALLVKEDVAAMVVPLALWIYFRRDKKVGGQILGVAVGFALLDNFLLIPAFLGHPTIYTDRIPFGGFRGVIRTVIRSPGQFIAYLRADERPYYLWQMGFANGFGFLLAPEVAAIGVLVIIENVLSNNIYMHTSTFWYSLPLVGLLSIGSAWAVGRQRTERRKNLVTVVVFVGALWSCVLWGFAPFSNSRIYEGVDQQSAMFKAMTYVERGIPSNASVSAYFIPWNTALDHRTQIYSWTNPFFDNAYGLPSQSGTRLPAANHVEYLVLPNPLPSGVDTTTFAAISSDYHVVRSAGGWRLYKKN
ncbi:MAG TPA: DUF2079 domain-containing protein [Acidimicrobiales bacterium]|nr:DUF2079 domain-containing protein [Acidimicrobiales bacterium]